jgi:hypothetical protein
MLDIFVGQMLVECTVHFQHLQVFSSTIEDIALFIVLHFIFVAVDEVYIVQIFIVAQYLVYLILLVGLSEAVEIKSTA